MVLSQNQVGSYFLSHVKFCVIALFFMQCMRTCFHYIHCQLHFALLKTYSLAEANCHANTTTHAQRAPQLEPNDHPPPPPYKAYRTAPPAVPYTVYNPGFNSANVTFQYDDTHGHPDNYHTRLKRQQNQLYSEYLSPVTSQPAPKNDDAYTQTALKSTHGATQDSGNDYARLRQQRKLSYGDYLNPIAVQPTPVDDNDDYVKPAITGDQQIDSRRPSDVYLDILDVRRASTT